MLFTKQSYFALIATKFEFLSCILVIFYQLIWHFKLIECKEKF